MSPTSYQLLYPAIFCFVVPVTGLEPVQYRYRGILSPLCLPIPPHRQLSAPIRIPQIRGCVKHENKKAEKKFRGGNSARRCTVPCNFSAAGAYTDGETTAKEEIKWNRKNPAAWAATWMT